MIISSIRETKSRMYAAPVYLAFRSMYSGDDSFDRFMSWTCVLSSDTFAISKTSTCEKNTIPNIRVTTA